LPPAARGGEESLRARAVTALAATESEDESTVVVALHEVGVARAARPGGLRFGALVHAILAAANLDEADGAALRALAQQQGRIVGARDDEVESATDAVSAALAHPLLRRAAAAGARGELRRETPVWLRQHDGSLAEGVVDLAFREDGAWTVVDFKTDAEVATNHAVYERQVRLYAAAVAAATGEVAHPVLLRV
jgi:ATP-dependent exoDNAse (exonuclease V) beta subunit